MVLSDELCFHISADVQSRVLDGEAVLLDLETGTYFGLNDVGSAIWQLLGQGRALGEIRRALLETFEVDEQTLRDDLQRLLADLHDRGLIRPRSSRTGGTGPGA